MRIMSFLPLSVVPKTLSNSPVFIGAKLKRLFLICFALCAIIALNARDISGKVVRVMDGDTIEILNNRVTYKIRLAGIDCPEKKQAYGMKAKAFTSGMVFGAHVTARVDTKDRYGRYVASVLLQNGKNLNYELLKSGLAWHYKQYSKSQIMAAMETTAKRKRLGLWAEKNPIPPWEFRKMKRIKHN
jgi:endonuclease YncB( thermonuclease family)